MRKEEGKSEPTKTSEQKKEPFISEILKQEKEVISHVVMFLVCVIRSMSVSMHR